MHDKTPANQMTAWWQTPLGESVSIREQQWLQSRAAGFSGYTQLQLGGGRQILPTLSRPCRQQWLAPGSELFGALRFLPYESDSIDQLLIQHLLEFTTAPHQLLREADRVLSEDGTLILFCFNPLSSWGIRKVFSRRSKTPWNGHFFSRARLKDWLTLLGYDIVESRAFLHQVPFLSLDSRWQTSYEQLGQRCWPYFGAVTVLVAKKHSIIVTPLRSRWSQHIPIFPKPALASRSLGREHSDGSC